MPILLPHPHLKDFISAARFVTPRTVLDETDLPASSFWAPLKIFPGRDVNNISIQQPPNSAQFTVLKHHLASIKMLPFLSYILNLLFVCVCIYLLVNLCTLIFVINFDMLP